MKIIRKDIKLTLKIQVIVRAHFKSSWSIWKVEFDRYLYALYMCGILHFFRHITCTTVQKEPGDGDGYFNISQVHRMDNSIQIYVINIIKCFSYFVCTIDKEEHPFLHKNMQAINCGDNFKMCSTVTMMLNPTNLLIVFWMCSWFMIQYTRKLFYISCSKQTDKGDKSLTLSKTNSFILEISPKTHFVMITMMLYMLLFRIHWSFYSLWDSSQIFLEA